MAGEQILIVEDESLIALELEEILVLDGYQVVGIVSSGNKAVHMAGSLMPDLILMDIRLKGTIDGIKAAQEIKKSHNIPVIFLSALSDKNSLERATLAEPYGYIVKPFQEKSLLATIQMVLYKSNKIREIEKREEWFSSVFNDLGESVILCNSSDNVLFINLSAEKLLKLKEEEVRGKTLDEFITLYHTLTKKIFKVPDQKEFINYSPIRLEDIILLKPNGTEIPVDLSVTPVRFDLAGSGLSGNTRAGLYPDKSLPEAKMGKLLMLRDIENRKKKNEKIQHEIETAIVMQKKLLPPHNNYINGMKLAWFLHPCSLSAGDLFHVIRIDDYHAGFYILDVMGHGISATITSLMLHRFLTPDPEKGGILKDIYKKPKPPVDVLKELNRHFYGQEPFQFFTLIYGIINTTTGKTRCVRAGHNYPVLQNPDGNISEILCEGAAIGLYPELSLTELTFSLKKKGRLFFYSDGLVECLNKDREQFSIQRLYSYIIETRKKSLKQLAGDLEGLLFQWKGTNYFNDDVSFMVLERV